MQFEPAENIAFFREKSVDGVRVCPYIAPNSLMQTSAKALFIRLFKELGLRTGVCFKARFYGSD